VADRAAASFTKMINKCEIRVSRKEFKIHNVVGW
jgi:hypothetical protein